MEKYSEGFAFIIHNEGSNIINKLNSTMASAEGLGYNGLPSGLAIEFDFNQSLNMDDPSYPHVSVQYRPEG
jgi:hypothetical protein